MRNPQFYVDAVHGFWQGFDWSAAGRERAAARKRGQAQHRAQWHRVMTEPGLGPLSAHLQTCPPCQKIAKPRVLSTLELCPVCGHVIAYRYRKDGSHARCPGRRSQRAIRRARRAARPHWTIEGYYDARDRREAARPGRQLRPYSVTVPREEAIPGRIRREAVARSRALLGPPPPRMMRPVQPRKAR
jgi:hypothetical protein